MSLPQWLLLRQKFLGAAYWVVARPLGWLAGYGLSFWRQNTVSFETISSRFTYLAGTCRTWWDGVLSASCLVLGLAQLQAQRSFGF